jgi:hypothetical protein
VQILDLLSDHPVVKAVLRPPRLYHGPASCVAASLADLIEAPELMVIAQPAAFFLNLLAAQAELAGATAGMLDVQNP